MQKLSAEKETLFTIRQPAKSSRQSSLSLLRKGSLNVALMAVLNRTIGIRGVAWASPIADAAALAISGVMLLCYLKRLNGESAPTPPSN